jgi:hypothetical protein
VAPALRLSDEDFESHLADLGRHRARMERLLDCGILEEGTHFRRRTGDGDGEIDLTLAGALAVKDALGLSIEWKESLERGDGQERPHISWKVECHVSTGLRRHRCVATADSFEAAFRYRPGPRTCPDCGAAAVRHCGGDGWYCGRREGGCGVEFGEMDPAIQAQVPELVESRLPRELSDNILATASARAIRRAVKRALGISRLPLSDDGDLRDPRPRLVTPNEVAPVAGATPRESAPDAETPAPGLSARTELPTGRPAADASRGQAQRKGEVGRQARRTRSKGAVVASIADAMPGVSGAVAVFDRGVTVAVSGGSRSVRATLPQAVPRAEEPAQDDHRAVILEHLRRRRGSAREFVEMALAALVITSPEGKLTPEVVEGLHEVEAGQLRAVLDARLTCRNLQVDRILNLCRDRIMDGTDKRAIAKTAGIDGELDYALVRGLEEGAAVKLAEALEAERRRLMGAD